MNVTVFGSLNVDHVYGLRSIVVPGESAAARTYRQFPGGKGLNQAVALARAGARVGFTGAVGEDGEMLIQALAAEGIDTFGIARLAEPSGHAMIQVADNGENAIVVAAGANRSFTPQLLASRLPREGWLLMQNETNALPEAFRFAGERGLKIAFNPSPWDDSLRDLPLRDVALLCVNRHEGGELSGAEDPEVIVQRLAATAPAATVVLTLGADGAIARCASGRSYRTRAPEVTAVDTTAAGDAFLGYLLSSYVVGKPLEDCLSIGARAAAITVTRHGASSSIPRAEEVALLGSPDNRE